MAARLLCTGDCAIITYARNLRWLCTRVRTFSSQGRNNSNERSPPPEVKEVTQEPIHSWLNIKAGIFGPSDHRLPLPGDIGLSQQLDTAPPVSSPYHTPHKKTYPDILTTHTNHQKQVEAINQVMENTVESDFDPDMHSDCETVEPKDLLECRAQDCPDLVKKDFLDLFPNRNMRDSQLSVITLCQRTEHDMSAWSEDMEFEREELIKHFITAADEICTLLQCKGYWADFIDPSSGRPTYGPYTNATFFETDERYRYLGFQIEDLGCCKVISHRLWGTNIFVGAVFTNAPINSSAMKLATVPYEKQNVE